MANIVSDTINEVVNSVGKIIGAPLAVRLISEEIERVKTMYPEIEDAKFSDSKVDIKLKAGVSEDKLKEILSTVLSSLEKSYSGVMGLVAKTIVKKSYETVYGNYKSKYPKLKDIAEKL